MEQRRSGHPQIVSTLPPSTALTHCRIPFALGLAGVLALYFLLAFFKLDLIPLVDPDEPRYACAGRTMSQAISAGEGHAVEALLIPQFNGIERINKPPLFYWLVACSDLLRGTSDEVSARLPSIFMGLLMLLATVFLARRVFGTSAALLSGAILATLLLFTALSRCCITDMTFSAFLVGALAMLMLGTLDLTSPNRSVWLASFSLGLALLTKATPALSLLLVVVIDRALSLPAERRPAVARFFPWILLAAILCSAVAMQLRKAEQLDFILKGLSMILSLAAVLILIAMAFRADRHPLGKTAWPIAFGFSLIMGLWWYLLLRIHFGAEKFWELISFETAGRLTGDVHREAMYYFIPALLGSCVPWSMGIPAALGSAWPQAETAQNPESRADRFLLAWVLGILFFFSIPGAKLATYILPAIPAVAILLARLLLRFSGRGEPIPLIYKKTTLAMAALFFIALVVGGSTSHLIPGEYRIFFSNLGVPIIAFSIAIGILAGAAWVLGTRGHVCKSAAIQIAIVTGIVIYFVPHSNALALENRSNRMICRTPKLREALPQTTRVIAMGADIESLNYYLNRTIVDLRHRRSDPKRKDLPEDPPTVIFNDELNRDEHVMMFFNRRFFYKLFNVHTDIATFEECARALPPGAEMLAKHGEFVAIRNRPAPKAAAK